MWIVKQRGMVRLAAFAAIGAMLVDVPVAQAEFAPVPMGPSARVTVGVRVQPIVTQRFAPVPQPFPMAGQHSTGFGFVGGPGWGYGYGYAYGPGYGYRYGYGYRVGGYGFRPWGGACRSQWMQCSRSFCCRKRSRRRFALSINVGGFFGLNLAKF